METPQLHWQWQEEASLSSRLGKGSVKFALLNSELLETNCAMSGAVVNNFRCSEAGILSWSFFVLFLLDYLLTTDNRKSTKLCNQM